MCGELYASSLPHMLWGWYSNCLDCLKKYFFFFYNTDISIFFSVVFIWFTKRNYCNEMWTHYAWWMLLWDDKARQVSSLELFLLFFSSDLRVKSWFLIDLITFTRFCCPICSKSIIDMSKTWKRIDEEVSYCKFELKPWMPDC